MIEQNISYFYKNIISSQICHNVPEWGRIQLASLGWFRFDCGTIWLALMDQDKPVSLISKHANTQFTHLWLICHKKFIHCSKWLAECYNANFASLWSLQVVIIMTTWLMTMLPSWRLSVFSAMSYQILDQYSLIPLYYLWWSGIFHHSEPFVKMWYESLFHTCHQTKLNNIVINDCNIL